METALLKRSFYRNVLLKQYAIRKAHCVNFEGPLEAVRQGEFDIFAAYC